MALAKTPMNTRYQSTDALVEGICSDPSTTFWLKEALLTLLQRDPVDAVNDSRILADIMQSRLDEVLQQSQQRQLG
jgi:hypothetical protein